MSERLHTSGERHEAPDSHKETDKSLERSLEKKAEQATHEHAEKIEEIRSKVESEATAKHEQEQDHTRHEKAEHDKPTFINRELKDMAYQRTLKRVRNQLPFVSRNFSKVIHHPVIETVSEIGGKTIARPSGILAGGIAAVIGSSFFLWAARHYGYEYNFLLFALLFAGGFFLGLLIEACLRLRRR